MQDSRELISTLENVANRIERETIKRQVRAVIHRLRYPMADILAKIYGDTLSERARKVGVSRQTMYVWADERFRPTMPQAKVISELTNVPVAQILDDGFDPEANHDTRRKDRKKAPRLAKRRKAAPGRVARPTAGRRRAVAAHGGAGKARKVHKGAGK